MKQKIWAAIDIGTNSVRLLLKQKIENTWEEKKFVCITQLGQGLSQRKHLCDQAMQRTQQAVIQFAKMAVEKGAQKPIWCYATSAARQADNGKDFLNRLTQSGWVTAELLSGEEEAEVAYIGSQAKGNPVLDVGGGSTELTIERNHMISGESIPLGCVTLKEKYLTEDPMLVEQREMLLKDCFAHTKKLTNSILTDGRAKDIVGDRKSVV